MLDSRFHNGTNPSEHNAHLKFFSTVRTTAIRFLPFISMRQDRNPEKAPAAMTTLGTLLTNLLFLGSTTIEDAIFRFDSHWIHRLSMNIEGSYSGSIAVDVPSNAGRFTASFEYAAVHDIQTADADVSDNRPFSLDAESTVAVHVPRNHSIHVQVARLDIALHDAVFPDDHSSRNGNVAVNTPVNADIVGPF